VKGPFKIQGRKGKKEGCRMEKRVKKIPGKPGIWGASAEKRGGGWSEGRKEPRRKKEGVHHTSREKE